MKRVVEEKHPKCVTGVDVNGVRLSFDPPIGMWAAMAQVDRFKREAVYVRDYRTGEAVSP